MTAASDGDAQATVERPIRVVIADDHPIVREGLRAILSTLPTLTVVGEASSGVEAVTTAAALEPDVVIMDLNMPPMGGIEATRRIVQANPRIRVLVLTIDEDHDSIFAAIRAGARGYLLKRAARTDIFRAITAVSEGEAIFSPGIAERVLSYFASGGNTRQTPAFPELTDRERELLDLIARGRSNQQIAAQLRISTKTVRNHVSNILTKLHVADRSQLIVKSRDHGFGQPQSPPGASKPIPPR